MRKERLESANAKSSSGARGELLSGLNRGSRRLVNLRRPFLKSLQTYYLSPHAPSIAAAALVVAAVLILTLVLLGLARHYATHHHHGELVPRAVRSFI